MVLEFLEFLDAGEVMMMKKVDDFLVRHFAREFIDIITAIRQLPFLSLNVAEKGARGNNAF